ncbi:hypothetical protein GCM10010326_65560 [Streptomyces xanthochromogenes]|uniref:Uncharacterized protein n=2 Tax=Streptomyces xanthochromogenes TaxID=67384 RepID=A0ABQ3AP53_9ACTN|nr:hypothetical protein GCM10010326_65560 [Streptomyces xanthochromogenes]
MEIIEPDGNTRMMSRNPLQESVQRGWDGSWYRVSTDAFEASFLPSPDEELDSVCNVEVLVKLKDGSRWSATVFTLAEVERPMKTWAGSGEALEGRYFWASDGLIVRDPGIDSMADVIAGLIEEEDFRAVLQRRADD